MICEPTSAVFASQLLAEAAVQKGVSARLSPPLASPANVITDFMQICVNRCHDRDMTLQGL